MIIFLAAAATKQTDYLESLFYLTYLPISSIIIFVKILAKHL